MSNGNTNSPTKERTEMYAAAPSPTRPYTSITIGYGMVTFGPLSVYTSTEETRVSRQEFLHGDINIPVGRSPIRKDTGAVVETADVTRMAKATNGNYVILTDDEIATCTLPRGIAEIVSFVHRDEFDAYLTENLYQVRPKVDKGKHNPAVERAFAVLLAGLRERNVGALIKVSVRGPARYAILTAEADLLMVKSVDHVRQPLPLADLDAVPVRERNMAVQFIDAIGIASPAIIDDTAPVVQGFVDAKAGGAPA